MLLGQKHNKTTKEKIRLSHLGKSQTEKTKIKISKTKTGKKHTLEQRLARSKKCKEMFLQGKSNLPYKIGGRRLNEDEKSRRTIEYEIWRLKILERDNYTCQICGDKNYLGRGKRIKLQIDHIKPLAYYPNLKYELSNGRTLCVKCHKKTPTFGVRVHNYMNTLIT